MPSKRRIDYTLLGTILNLWFVRMLVRRPNVSVTIHTKCMTILMEVLEKSNARLETVNVSILAICLFTVLKTSNVHVNIHTQVTSQTKRLVLNAHVKDSLLVGLALAGSNMDSIKLFMRNRKPKKRKARLWG